MITISENTKVFVVVHVLITFVFLFWLFSEINPDVRHQLTEADKQYLENYNNEITFIGDEAYPPFSFTHNDIFSGYEAELISNLQNKLGIVINYQQMNWNDALQLLEKGAPVVITGMKVSEERQEKYLFTDPYLVTTQSLITPTYLDIAPIGAMEELRVIVQENSITHDLAKKNNPKEILVVREPREGLQLLMEGKGDAWIENQMTAIYYLRLFNQDQLYAINVLEETNGYYAMALPEDQEILRGILNKALYQLDKQGTIAVLDNKWFGMIGHRSYIETSVMFYAIIVAYILATAAFAFYLWNKTLLYQLGRRTADLKNTNDLLHKERGNIQSLLEGIAQSFSTAIGYKDDYTGNHSRRVTNICILIANEMRLSEQEVFETYIGALLHDIGKVGIPDNILKKEGTLTKEEYEAIKQHPLIGAKILSEITSYKAIRDAVKYHHERWDGNTNTQYPAYPGLVRGDEIPLIARIIAVADSYDAMTTDRPYRKGLCNAEAMRRLQQDAGKQFDPKIVDCFFTIVEQLEEVSLFDESFTSQTTV